MGLNKIVQETAVGHAFDDGKRGQTLKTKNNFVNLKNNHKHFYKILFLLLSI